MENGYSGRQKKIILEYQVESLSEKIRVGTTDYNAVHISGKGIAKAFMMKIPVDEDRWVHKDLGTIKSITKQTIAKIEATTTLTLKTDKKK